MVLFGILSLAYYFPFRTIQFGYTGILWPDYMYFIRSANCRK